MAIPQHQPDKIIGIFSGSLTIGAFTGLFAPYSEQTFTTGFNDTCLTRCVYRVDGGQSNDDNFGVEAGGLANSITASSFSRNNLAGIAVRNSDTSSAHTITFDIYCYAKQTQGSVEPIKTNQALSYASKYNYEKIFIEDIVPVTTSTSANVSVPIVHGLGYIPDTKTSIEYVSANVVSGSFTYDDGSVWPAAMSQIPDFNSGPVTHNAAYCSVGLTPTTATYTFAPDPNVELSLNLHYRIYLDD